MLFRSPTGYRPAPRHPGSRGLRLSANFVRPRTPFRSQGRVFGRGNGHGNGSSNRPGFSGKNNHGPTSTCSLCGHRDHKASQGCPNIRTDSGQIYKTTSVYGTCSLCPGTKKNTLNHPPALCPFRKGGPLEHERH